jgi:hypothetical protein
MTQYLENKICKFTPLFDIDYTKKQNIISISFFKIYGKGYKDLSLYINGIKLLNKYVHILDNFRVRLFIDNSIYSDKDIMGILNELKNTDLVLYSCPSLLEEDKKHHIGVFGTFARMFPLFDFPNNDAGIIQMYDIDYKSDKHVINLYNSCKSHMKVLKRFNVRSSLSTYMYLFMHKYIMKKHKKEWKYNIRMGGYVATYVDIGEAVLSKERTPHQVLYDFLGDHDKYEDEVKYLTGFFDHTNTGLGKFRYGLNSYFMNVVLLGDILKKKIPYSFILRFTILESLYAYIKIGEKEDKEYERFFTNVLKHDDKFKFESAAKGYGYLDNILYPIIKGKKELNNESNKLIMNIYIYFIIIYKTKYAEYYNKQFLDFILNDSFIGIYYGNFVSGYHINNIKNNFITKRSLSNEDISVLKNKKKQYDVNTLELKLP